MDTSIEGLKKLKAQLEEKRSSIAAEQKFLEAEKKRVTEKLFSLGFKSLSELKEAKVKLQAQLDASLKSLESSLQQLESADSNTLEMREPKTKPEEQPLIASNKQSIPTSILDDIF